MKRGAGFTLIEIMVVLTIMGLGLTAVSLTFSSYLSRSAARRAAEVFSQDLTVARNTASRSRQSVVLEFDERELSYLIRVGTRNNDPILLTRSFGQDSDFNLTFLDLQMRRDEVTFNSRGVADLSGAEEGPLGRAVFTAGNTTYAVSFNSMGSSRVEES